MRHPLTSHTESYTFRKIASNHAMEQPAHSIIYLPIAMTSLLDVEMGASK